MKIKKGQEVTIYTDPHTKTEIEGTAIIKQIRLNNGHIALCQVKFNNDTELYDRVIKLD